MRPREDRPPDRPLLDVHAFVYVERPSQKAIVIGPKGARLKDIGTSARKGIEALLGTPVFLARHGTVAKGWQRTPNQLRKLGFWPRVSAASRSIVAATQPGASIH